jgi:CheY-like chemotaxis protein
LLAALAYFADSPGIRRAVVAFPNDMIAGNLAAMLSGLGYEVDTVGNGRRAYLQALTSGDYELILLSGRLDHPPVWVTLQQLRHEPATARLPIGLLAEPGDVPYLESVASEDGSNRSPPRSRDILVGPNANYTSLSDSEFGDGHLTAVFERPITPEGLKFFTDRLVQRAAGQLVPADVRQKQALAALAWLKQLYGASPHDFSLRPFEATFTRALLRPATSAAAAELLALIGSHTAQKALVDLANMGTQPLAMRQSAAAAFSAAVRKYGIQLTSSEIKNQYDRYNLSRTEEPAVQQLLGLMLDAIEFPTKK